MLRHRLSTSDLSLAGILMLMCRDSAGPDSAGPRRGCKPLLILIFLF